MSELTLYHNSHCSKSREALCLLENTGRQFRVVNYLTSPPTPAELTRLLSQLKLEPQDIVRTKEDRYRELDLENSPPQSLEQWVQIICENPILMERPILSDGNRAVIGRPPERVRDLL